MIDPAVLVVLAPLLAALLLAGLGAGRAGDPIAIAGATLAFALSCRLPWHLNQGDGLLRVDALAAHMAILTSFVAMTTTWFAAATRAAADSQRPRATHVLLQLFSGCMLLALLSDNTALTWVGLEAATIAAVLAVGLPGTAHALEASWKFLILCSVGLALALFGTIVLYLAAQPVLGTGLETMRWSRLAAAAPGFKAPLLNLAFVFLLVGYATKAGLAPLHGWLADAHAEGPTPISAVLAGSILNVALVAILRLRQIMAATPQAIDPGAPILAFATLSVMLASLALWRRRDVKRFFAYSTIEQSGVAALAIGLGGQAAILAGVLHITVHTLVKAAVFQCVGHACRLKGSQLFADIGGLLIDRRALGLTLAASIVAVAGLPPFGLFASLFLLLSELARRLPWLLAPVGLCLAVGAWALLARLVQLCAGEPTADRGPAPGLAALAPAWLHLALAALLGFAMPAELANWFTAVAAGAR